MSPLPFVFRGNSHLCPPCDYVLREGWSGEGRGHLYPGFLFFRSQGVQVTVVDTSQDSKSWQTVTVLSAAGALREQLEQTVTEALGQAECSG